MKYKTHNNYESSSETCRKCGESMMEISHKVIKDKHLKQPFYYRKWYRCPNCKWCLNKDEDKVWNKNDASDYLKINDEFRNQQQHLFDIKKEI